MKTRIIVISALLALGSVQALAQTNKLSSVAVDGLGVATVTERVGVVGNQVGAVGNSLSGLAYVAGNVPVTGGPASNSFWALSVSGASGATVIPSSSTAFMSYGSLTFPTQVNAYADISAKLGVLSPAGSYSGLAFSADDLGFGGAFQFYMIDHRGGTDYFAQITPGTGTSSLVRDLKPMSWPGGVAATPSDTGLSGYFAIAYGSTVVSPYPANSIYYLRTDASNHTQFGTVIPALTSGSQDRIDLNTAVGAFGATGYSTLIWMTDAVAGNPANQFYYLRQDTAAGGSGNTILGRLNPDLVPGVRTISDIANLGGVFNTLTYSPDATGNTPAWGSTQFFATGALAAGAQSVSFAAIADRAIATGSFPVSPSASSGLAITLTVDPSSTGAASISGPSGVIFTVTPTAPGIIKLKATQAGGGGFLANFLSQSFNATGVATLAFTTQPTSHSAATNTTTTFTVAATGTSTIGFQWRKNGASIIGNASALTATLSLPNVQASDGASYDVVATNASGSIISNSATLTILPPAPAITNSPLTASGTVGSAFSFQITASNNPTSFSAAGLPGGLTINTANGLISGTPTTAATSSVTLGATSASGTGNATLTLTVASAAVAPVITNNPLTAGGTVGSAFSFQITASNTPTSFSAAGLPAGLTVNTANGLISGTPTTAATTSVTLGATNGGGTGSATLTITVGAIGAAPVITNSPLTASGTIGAAFTFAITASGSPTSFAASPLPAGLTVNTATGVISGTPTTAGTTSVVLGATNSSGTGAATLTITVAGTSGTPSITSATTASGRVGTAFATYTITATGSPTSFAAAGLPAGLALNATTGAITGTPTINRTSTVTLSATNAIGTGTSTLTITIAPDLSAAFFPQPTAITIDAAGNLYVSDPSAQTIARISPANIVTLVAGFRNQTGTTDANGSLARFNGPTGIFAAADGSLTVSDTANGTIRRISTNGTVTTLAGNTTGRGNTDGTGSAATFTSPRNVGADSAGNLYIADQLNHTIRKVTTGGVVTTFAGSAGVSGSTDGTGSAARFNRPTGVVVDANGNVFVSDTTNNTIRKITPAGVVTTIAGLAGVAGFTDGAGNLALFNRPTGLAVDSAGNIFIADTGNSTIRKMTQAGVVTTVAGLPGIAGLRDGTGIDVLFNQPESLVVDAAGNIFVADTGNAVIRKITPAGVVTTLPLTEGPITPVVTTPPTTPATTTAGTASGRSGGGLPSLWFFAALAALAGLRRKFTGQ